MNARELIEALVAHEGRGPGTDAERRAARDLQNRVEGTGREAALEPFEVRPSYPLAHAIHATLAIAGSVVSVSSALVGAILVLLAVVLAFGDATGMFMLTRRLTGRRASQNVVSDEDGDKPGTLVLVAHYDAGRTGAIFNPRLQSVPVFSVFFGSLVLVLLCCIARLPGLDGMALTAVQFVPTVVLIVSVPLLVDIALSGVVPGANDNASGVATVFRLGERYGGSLEHFDLCVVLTGSQEGFALGMRAFLKRRRKQLSKERTVFVNIDEVGAGHVRYTQSEGLLLRARSHVQLVDICDEIAEDDDADTFGARPFRSRTASDGYAARSAGFPAITVSSRPAPDHHLPTDTSVDDDALDRAFGFCCELVERLDAAIGPDLDRGGISEEPVPSP